MTDVAHFGLPDDVAFAKHLVESIGVASVPGSSFYRIGLRVGRSIEGPVLLPRSATRRCEEADRRLAKLKGEL